MELFSLISSLPYLKLFEKPAITSEKFLYFCSSYFHGRKMALLERLTLVPGQGTSDKKSLILKGLTELSGRKMETDGSVYDMAFRSFEAEITRSFPERSVARMYTRYEMALRNSIAKVRAAKWKQGEMGPAARLDGGYMADADRVVQEAFAAPNPLERERILDRARWEKLDEYARIFNLHGFSFDAVCAYCLKLQIAEKWAERSEKAAAGNLDRAAELVRAVNTENN